MSYWTHIIAAIDVETWITDNGIKGRVEKMLENAPKITGSEGNADVFVSVLSGGNFFISCDCERCEFSRGETCINEDESYECPNAEYQTRVAITITGSLRDREKSETLSEYNDFIKFLKRDCKFTIRNRAMKISS